MRHPERSKQSGELFAESNHPIGWRPFGAGSTKRRAFVFREILFALANTFAEAKVRLRKTPHCGVLLRSG